MKTKRQEILEVLQKLANRVWGEQEYTLTEETVLTDVEFSYSEGQSEDDLNDLNLVELVLDIEEHYSYAFEIDDEIASSWKTVKDIIDFLESKI